MARHNSSKEGIRLRCLLTLLFSFFPILSQAVLLPFILPVGKSPFREDGRRVFEGREGVFEGKGCDTLSILFAGDVLFDRGVREAMAQWPDTLSLRQHGEDALVVNLECPITTHQSAVSKQIVFRADTLCADLMQRMGITHAALANNHSVDRGQTGLQHTAYHLNRVGIKPLGYGMDAATRIQPIIISKGEVEVAIFNDITFPVENWVGSVEDGQPNIANLSVDSLSSVIRTYHQQHPKQHIVAFLHWGTEFRTTPTMRQRIDASRLAAAGCEAIIGQHPHVVQPMQLIGRTPVFYSLGNYIFDQQQPLCREALTIRLLFTRDGLATYESVPVSIDNCLPEENLMI